MDRKLMASTLPLTLLVISIVVLTAPVGAECPPPLAEGCGFMRVDGCKCVHGCATLYSDGGAMDLQIIDDGVSYYRHWNIKEHYAKCGFEVFKCWSPCWGNLWVIICGSRAMAFGSGVFFFGKLVV